MALSQAQIEIRLASMLEDIAAIKTVITKLQTKLNAKSVGLVVDAEIQDHERDVATIQAADSVQNTKIADLIDRVTLLEQKVTS